MLSSKSSLYTKQELYRIMVLVMRLYSPVPNMCVMILVIPQYVKCSPYHLSEEVLNLSIFSHYLVFYVKIHCGIWWFLIYL